MNISLKQISLSKKKYGSILLSSYYQKNLKLVSIVFLPRTERSKAISQIDPELGRIRKVGKDGRTEKGYKLLKFLVILFFHFKWIPPLRLDHKSSFPCIILRKPKQKRRRLDMTIFSPE